jgi:hypothetical protein
VSLRKCRHLAAKVRTTKNLPMLQPVVIIQFSSLLFVMPKRLKSYILIYEINLEALYTYFITKRESCFEFVYFIVRLLVECKNTNFRNAFKLTLDQCSERKRSMPNDNTQIPSHRVRHDSTPYSSEIGST